MWIFQTTDNQTVNLDRMTRVDRDASGTARQVHLDDGQTVTVSDSGDVADLDIILARAAAVNRAVLDDAFAALS